MVTHMTMLQSGPDPVPYDERVPPYDERDAPDPYLQSVPRYPDGKLKPLFSSSIIMIRAFLPHT